MSKIKEKTKDLYVDHVEGDEPNWFLKLCETIEFSAPGLFFYRLIHGGDYFCGIKYIPENIEWFYQRVVRGYSDNQLWSLDYYLGRHIIKTLKAFKKMKKTGVPMEYTQPQGFNTPKNKCIPMKTAQKNWERDIQDMIEGFEFLTESGDFYYNVCRKKYPKKEDNKKRQAMYNKALTEAQEKASKFIQHFNSLWD